MKKLTKVAKHERIASDLHAVQRHTLSLIIVKSTLAGKLLEIDPAKAKNEIADIEKVSREAMADIRNTLRGYSTYKLCDELQRAKSALESAGVAVESDATELTMSPALESVAALIMREAVTNVVRHAHARHCVLRIAPNNENCVLEIQDDGRGGIKLRAMVFAGCASGLRRWAGRSHGIHQPERSLGLNFHWLHPPTESIESCY